MDVFIDYLLTAFAMIFVIEGLLYAVFPDAMRRMLALALTLPSSTLRRFGIGMVACGFALVALLQMLAL
tara:strand:- start:915 stop:1121 length:207 start_codon:yes stop_codon:yes gene_type:complete